MKTEPNSSAILLDTHAVIWWSTGDRALSRKVKRLIEDDQTEVVVSAATAWEIATKTRLGKLRWDSPDSVEAYCIGQRFTLLAMTFAHSERAGSWPGSHGDPFDRMLAAQSAIERIPIASSDPRIAEFGVKTIW